MTWMSYPKKPKENKEFCHSYPPLSESLWPMMRRYLERRGLSHSLAMVNGWYPSARAGDALPRVVIPASASDPKNKFWQARLMLEVGKAAKRYESPYGARGDAIITVYPRIEGDTLYENKDQAKCTIIAEGPMDALAAASCDYFGIALMGNSPSYETIARAVRLAKKPIIIVGDLDAIGAAVKILMIFCTHENFPLIRSPYPYKDLASMPPDYRLGFLQGVVS